MRLYPTFPPAGLLSTFVRRVLNNVPVAACRSFNPGNPTFRLEGEQMILHWDSSSCGYEIIFCWVFFLLFYPASKLKLFRVYFPSIPAKSLPLLLLVEDWPEFWITKVNPCNVYCIWRAGFPHADRPGNSQGGLGCTRRRLDVCGHTVSSFWTGPVAKLNRERRNPSVSALQRDTKFSEAN